MTKRMIHKCRLRCDSISHLPKILPDAPWHARWKRSFRKFFLVSLNHPEVRVKRYLKSDTAVEKESRRQVKHHSLVIHPLSEFRKFWDIFIFLMLFFHQLITPFAIGFFVDLDDSTIDLLITCDIAICFILFVEVLISFRTGYIVKETNEIILAPKIIAQKYIRHFIPDVICCVPYIFLTTHILEEHDGIINGATIVYMCCLFFFSFYRFRRILCYFSSIPIILKLSETGTIVMKLCLRTIYCWHWASCVRRLVPLHLDQKNMLGNNWTEDKHVESKFFVKRLNLIDTFEYEGVENLILEDLQEIFTNYTMLNMYTRTMMVTLKLVLQSGYGNETSDSIYNMLMSTFLMFAGWIYSTYVLILISNVLMASANSENKFEEISNELDAFCEAKCLPRELREKVKTFFKYKFKKHYFNEDAIRDSTPANLSKEIMMHACSNLVEKVTLFKDIPQVLLENIIKCLKLEIFFPGDIIIKAGTVGEAMFFIAFGSAAIYSSAGKLMVTVSDGSHVGEVAILIKGQKRIASVVALEMCECYKLTQKDFRKVIEPHPSILLKMEQTALERIKSVRNQTNY